MVAVRSWVRGRIGHAGQVKGRGRQVVVRVVVVLVLLCVVAVMGRVWWTHPLKRSAALPPGTEQGETFPIRGNLPSPRTIDGGIFYAENVRSVNHEWVITAKWHPHGGPTQAVDLRLGESVHFDGFGTVTWIKAAPPPIIELGEPEPGGGRRSGIQSCSRPRRESIRK